MNQPEFLFKYASEHRAIWVLMRDPLAFKSITPGWLLKNKPVWQEFHSRTEALRRVGRDHFGAKAIYEAMRYDSAINDSETTFKLNNNSVSGLARLYNAVSGVDYFETRT